jgi:hypothetical protein
MGYSASVEKGYSMSNNETQTTQSIPFVPNFRRRGKIAKLCRKTRDLLHLRLDQGLPDRLARALTAQITAALRRLNPSQSQPTNSTATGTMNPFYQRHARNCNCTAIAPELQSNCTRIAPELQQKPSNCTQLQQNHIGWGGGDLQHEATQPRGTANWCNRLAKPPAPVIVPISLRACFENRSRGLAAGRGGWLRCSVIDCLNMRPHRGRTDKSFNPILDDDSVPPGFPPHPCTKPHFPFPLH